MFEMGVTVPRSHVVVFALMFAEAATRSDPAVPLLRLAPNVFAAVAVETEN